MEGVDLGSNQSKPEKSLIQRRTKAAREGSGQDSSIELEKQLGVGSRSSESEKATQAGNIERRCDSKGIPNQRNDELSNSADDTAEGWVTQDIRDKVRGALATKHLN
ncbi:hypothetical protein C8J56DRAFT_886756 [Mycena floridula]|nr:hypothetical protein C8J56DRAFT_886756 [Mycena floridula]